MELFVWKDLSPSNPVAQKGLSKASQVLLKDFSKTQQIGHVQINPIFDFFEIKISIFGKNGQILGQIG